MILPLTFELHFRVGQSEQGGGHDPTLMAWMANVDKHRQELEHRGYDERFYRMWRYYLLGAAGSDRARCNQLWQIVYSKKGLDGGYESIR
jgi:cyclopropane-fatty-acyl-phospholipid synthase